jgi:hypothetical protein
MEGSKTPYTEAEIKDGVCGRCGAPSEFQWSACADGNLWRKLCGPCDLALNAIVMEWYGFKDWRRKVRRYATKIGLKWPPNKEN